MGKMALLNYLLLRENLQISIKTFLINGYNTDESLARGILKSFCLQSV